jgi:hypothetical protein
VGSSCGPLFAREKDLRNGWRAEPTTSLKIRTCFCRPILIALLFCLPFARAYESRKMSHRGETGSSSTARTRVAPRGAHALIRMAVVGRRSFPSTKAISAPALIVGERSIAALQLERDVTPLIRQGPSPCAVSVRASLQEGAGDERGPALKAARNRSERPGRAGSLRAHALLAAVRAHLALAFQAADR